jgi:branched-chain amino acid transport system substrate-binding protein
MKRLTRLAAVLAAAAAIPAFAQPVPIVGLVELSGTGATAGTNFDNGVKLAVKEINAAGGLLGRKIEYVSMDTQSQPNVAKGLAQKAVDQNAYVVMGPVFSGSIIVSMAETKRAEIPNFTGGEAASITQQGNPYIFRTSFTQATAMPKLAKYIKDGIKANTVAMIWVNNDFGKGGRDAMQKALDAVGVKVVADVSTDPGQVDFSGAVLKIKQANPDAVFVYTNEEESARALRELKKQGVDKPIIGETTLTGQKVIELGGRRCERRAAARRTHRRCAAAVHQGLRPQVPGEYKYKSDHNGMKGYSAMYVVKAIAEKNKKIDGKEFAKAMHGAKISAKDYPGVLLDVTFDNNGDLGSRKLPRQGRERQAGRHRDAAAGLRKISHITRRQAWPHPAGCGSRPAGYQGVMMKSCPANPGLRPVVLTASAVALAQGQPIPIVGLLELSGAGASVGNNMKNGMDLAVKEINASGGVLGRKLEVTVLDTQDEPERRQGARAEGDRHERLCGPWDRSSRDRSPSA